MATPLCQVHKALLLVVFLPLVQAGEWYYHEYEYNYVEALILIVLIVIALVFENTWHFVQHQSHHSYRYGHLHDQVSNDMFHSVEDRDGHGNVRHFRLYQELVDRAGGEFMTLGVLAFSTFLFNNAGGFKAMENVYKDEKNIHLPKTSQDWLHMVEVVHVKLFVAMVLYFTLILAGVRSALKQIQNWENCRLRRVKSAADGHDMVWSTELEVHMSQYLLWRDYFIERVVNWRKKRPALYRETLEKLDIPVSDKEAPALLRKEMERRFAFSAYLALNVGEGICDSIHVHKQTWVVMLALFGCMAILHRYPKIDMFVFTWIFLGLSIVVILLMAWKVKKELSKITRHGIDKFASQQILGVTGSESVGSADSNTSIGHGDEIWPPPDMGTATEKTRVDANGHEIQNFHQRHSTELLYMRALQIVLWLVSYVFARTLMDFHSWEVYPQATLLSVCGFTLCFILLISIIQSWVPTFLALMSLPPYVDESNLQYFFAVLLDDHNITELGQSLPRPISREVSSALPVQMDDSYASLVSKVDLLSARLATMSSNGDSGSTKAAQSDLAAVWTELRRLEHKLDTVSQMRHSI